MRNQPHADSADLGAAARLPLFACADLAAACAVPAAPSAAPGSDNAPGQGRVIEGQGKHYSSDFADDDGQRKALATMYAKAVQAGCTLHELSGGGFLLCRWGMAKELPCLRAVGDLLRRIGGRHG